MSVWLKVTLIVLAAMLVSIGVSLVPAASSLPSPPPRSSLPTFPDEALMKALFDRPPQAAVDACVGSARRSPLTHDDFVRVATCLHRRHFVSAQTVKAVEGDPSLGARRIVGLKTKTTTGTWWWALTWGVALAAIALVVYRHLRRRPPPSGTAALSR